VLFPGARERLAVTAEQYLRAMRYIWLSGPKSTLRGEVLAVLERIAERPDVDFQVAEASDGYAAVGRGAQVALGALYATTRLRDPRRRILVALEAAEHFSSHVRRPFVIVEAPAPQ
jgi:hypothetical protein